jgi:spectinomycin phosphotransferase
MNASVYKAEASNKSAYFLKLKRGQSHDISVLVTELLHDAGIQQIIPIIKTIRGQSTQPIDDCILVVFPFIEGQDGFSRDLTDSQWKILGKVMRQIHNIEIPPALQNKIRRESYAFKWGEVVRSIYSHFETVQSDDAITLKLGMFLIKHKMTIHCLVDRAEKLNQQIKDQLPEFVLCHSDIHGGNVLIDRNDDLYIVDWDDPIMAPKERDLMFIGAGVANVWNKPFEGKLFYQGYGKMEVNMAILAYYRYVRIVEDIALYGQQLLIPTLEDQTRLRLYKQFIDQFKPNGVVEIAFKTAALDL